jgi:ribose transport system substrate-binding protein
MGSKRLFLEVFAVVVVMLCLIFTGQVSAVEKENPLEGMAVKADGKPLRVGIMANETASEWMTVFTGFSKSLIERAGGKVIIFNADLNTAKEIAGMEDMINSKVDAIVLHPTNSRAIVSGVEKANKAGTLCFTADIPVYGGEITTHVGLSQEKMGELAGGYLVEQFKDKPAKILEIWGHLGVGLAEPRDAGFRKAIKGRDNIKIVAEHVCDWRNELSMNATMDALQSHPDINAVYVHSDCMLEGVVQALAQLNRLVPKGDPKHIFIVSIDGTPETLKKVRAGTTDAVIEHNSALHADIMTKVLITKLILGKDVPKKVELPIAVITQANVDNPQNWGNLPSGQFDKWPVFKTDIFPTPVKK